jgi:hypothetical protein
VKSQKNCCFLKALFFQITLFLSFNSEQGTPTLLLEKGNQPITESFHKIDFAVKAVRVNKQHIPAVLPKKALKRLFLVWGFHHNSYKL